jgi:hypothetical protein
MRPIPENDPDDAQAPDEAPVSDAAERDTGTPARDERPVEIGGRDGLDPTRYGDWEKGGRCIDF